MKIQFLLFFMLVANMLFSQAGISSSLLNHLNNNEQEYVNVNIFFYNKIDINELAQELDKSKASFDERIKKVSLNQKLNSEYSQKVFLDNIYKIKSDNAEITKNHMFYWVVNMVNTDIKPEFINQVLRFENIRYIDINSPRYRIEDIQVTDGIKQKSLNSAEPGLKAINAHKLWELGYSGRNVLFLSADTGVNTDHPAISDNFAGNYLPMNQCWYGVRSEYPVDYSSSSHGTHTTGTALGLDRNTNDTIGVAFNAKWIATDPVADSNSDLLTPEEFMGIFQWAMDPDGDPETTDDVPRVINNSWGFDYNIAEEFDGCNLVEAEILITLETAGICAPFSAGNEGPGISTIGFPAFLAFNEVNPFSIGALNPDYTTIANFSSIGPSICIYEEGMRKIKPEVSAPGVNIRSAYGRNNYKYASGTSMACPHVSGALMLLIEAFPEISARELKNALYVTSIDLGTEGEDNVFGRGLIDVYEAYLYLSESYSPNSPVPNNYDLVTRILSPANSIGCFDDNNDIIVNIKNNGTNTINGYNLKIFVNDTMVSDNNINEPILPGGEYDFTIYNYNFVKTYNSIFATVKSVESLTEFDRFNNSHIINFSVNSKEDYPLSEDFENINNISELGWLILNPDNSKTWEIITWGNNNEYKSIGMDFYRYSELNREKDYLLIPEIEIPDSENTYLNFVYSYRNRSKYNYNDTLIIELSTDCGNTFPYTLFKRGGQGLGTVPDSSNGDFKPVSYDEFDTISIDLNQFSGQRITIRFGSKNDRGSILYIDKIDFGEQRGHIYVKPVYEKSDLLYLYPNPSGGDINIEVPQNEILEIYNINGQIIKRINLNTGLNSIDCNDLASGNYIFILVNSGSKSKVVIN